MEGQMMQVNNFRVSRKYFKTAKQTWYCKLTLPTGERKDYKLDADEEKAEKVRLVLVAKLERDATPTVDYLVRDLIDLFLDHAKANNAAETYRWYRDFLKTFYESIPATLTVE
jgi:hypothetical protein